LIISFVCQSCVLCRVFVCIVHFCHRASSCLLSFGFYSLSIFMVLFWYGFWSIVSFEFSFFPFWRPSPKCPLSIVSKVFCLLYFVSRIFSWSLSVSCLVLFLVLCLLSPVSLVFCLLYLLYCLLCLLSFICWGVSSVHCLVSVVVFCLLSVVMCALPSVFVKCLISNVLCLFFCHMSFLYCHFSFIFCQLSFLFCHLSSIFCQLSCRVSFAFCPSLRLLSWNLCISIGQDLIASLLWGIRKVWFTSQLQCVLFENDEYVFLD